jgi:hypothetical protein
MRCELPFGGKVMVFDGDFRQVLPLCHEVLGHKLRMPLC